MHGAECRGAARIQSAKKGGKSSLGRGNHRSPKGNCRNVFKMNMERMNALARRAGCALKD